MSQVSSRSCTATRSTRRVTSTPARRSTDGASRSSCTSSATMATGRATATAIVSNRSWARPGTLAFPAVLPRNAMTHRWPRLATCTIALCVAFCATLAQAHEFKLDAVINGFVTVTAGEAHFVVRAPLYLFKSAKLPIKNGEIDVPQSQAAIDRSLAALQQDIALFQDGRKLISSTSTGRLSLPSDRSFQTYDEAVRHVVEPVAPDTQIFV